MNIQFDDSCRLHNICGAIQIIVKSTTTLGLAAAALIASLAASANAETRAAWSSSFNDSLWINNRVGHSKNLSWPVPEWTPQCLVSCGPIFGARIVRRTQLLSTNSADVSGNKVVDLTGHAMAVSGMIVIERLDPSGFGQDPSLPTNWQVVGERVFDGNETHSWSLLSADTSLDAHWLPIQLYRFEDTSFSMNIEAGMRTGATPEPSTWAMMIIGFAGLCFAGYRNSKKHPLLRSSSQTSGVLSGA